MEEITLMSKELKILNRFKLIKQMRREGRTLFEIGEFLNPRITRERVRQILSEPAWNYCRVHKRKYFRHCIHCTTESDYLFTLNKVLSKIGKNLITECERLSIQSRSKTLVIQRQMLIKKLRDKVRLSYQEIGFLLKRHHSSIMYLYKK